MTAIVRRMDNLGRVVIPKEMRTQLEMGPGTPMEIVGTDDGIFLRKQQELPLSERVRRLREEAIQEGAPVEVIYQMNQLLDILEDC
ncbi:AbrB/MazE/SpoVT family DNA-binding domain-containing protein [Flintibacter sp. KGMB00164]|uniref:AbrB/MazE/SpoVT family DNA-binding domain-containing protein n=1 Tax=Flintibacter sp. KGMB00164 TaxID=2610895 RepID=UPI0012483AEC|nr:AbrB/MazE/SpoVT family DNA-binding domain-containing protein [Flintibacter sp. KGMB00164]